MGHRSAAAAALILLAGCGEQSGRPGLAGASQIPPDVALFAFSDRTTGEELWRMDPLPRYAESLIDVGGTLFFTVRAPVPGLGQALWKSDGTEVGTVKVREFSSSSLRPLAGSRRFLFFSFGADQERLWRSDGTDAGTLELLGMPGTQVRRASLCLCSPTP